MNGTVSKTGNARKTAVPGKISASAGYAVSLGIGKWIEEAFGWGKITAGLPQLKRRGLAKAGGVFV